MVAAAREAPRVLEDLGDDEAALVCILSDLSGLDQAEFLWLDETADDGCWRAWDFQWCFAGETVVLTAEGHRLIRDLVGKAVLLTEGGRWVDAEVRYFGRQPIVELMVERYGVQKTIRTTANHHWFASSERQRERRSYGVVTTEDLQPGSFLQSARPPRRPDLAVDPDGVVHGLVWGDGTRVKGTSRITLWGEKLECSGFFDGPGSLANRPDVSVPGRTWYQLPLHRKDPVSLDEHPSYLYGWLAGYFAADGSVSPDGTCQLSSVSRTSLELVRDVCLKLGITTGQIAAHPRLGGYGGPAIELALTVRSSDLDEQFFLRTSHRSKWLNRRSEYEPRDWKVVGVHPTGVTEDVFCAVVPETHSFTLDGYLLTGNCWFRDPSPLAIDQCGRSLGKSTSIVLRACAFPLVFPGDEMVITAPEFVHLDPVTSLVETRLTSTRLYREMLPSAKSSITHRPFKVQFSNGARIMGRIPQRDGKGVKGCLAEGTLLLTERGHIPVEDARVGDRVLTHEGRWMPIIELWEDVNDCYEVRGQSSFPMTVSCDHRFLAVENHAGPKQKRRFSEPLFMDVEDLEEFQAYWATPTVVAPLPVPGVDGFDMEQNEFWWLIGRYLADGWTSTQDRIGWCVPERKRPALLHALETLGRKPWVQQRAHSAGDLVTIASTSWARWIEEHFGRLAGGKKLPPWAFGMPETHRRALLDGYLAGDGWFNQQKKRWEVGTASKVLAVGVQLLAQTLGHTVNCTAVQPKVASICGTALKAEPQVSWRLQIGDGHPHRMGDFLFAKIKTVTPVGKRRVFNPVVEEDHSYISNSIVSHNIHPLWLEMDESQDYPHAGWVEITETLKRGMRGARWRAHGVTRGIRDDFYERTQDSPDNPWVVHRYSAMWRPTWCDEERSEKMKQYGSRDDPDYRRNVLGLHGDTSNPLFVLTRLMAACDSEETSDYNANEYFHATIKAETLAYYGNDILDLLDFPERHKRYLGTTKKAKAFFWVGMDVGYTNDPSEILVFVEYRPRPADEFSKLKLLSRVHMQRIGHGDQVAAILRTIDFYRPRVFAMDKTGLGLPLFQDIQERCVADPAQRWILDVIKGYGFSEKIIVDLDESIALSEHADAAETAKVAGIRRSVLEYASDILRGLVDARRLELPWDPELLKQFQGSTWTQARSMDQYGRKLFSSHNCHTLDGARMAVLGYAQHRIETILAEKETPPVYDTFLAMQ